uniref:Uncharacterized protein n=1 Tax=Oscillatoriales cyanobacterium SpSt-418 TaxID=2282169 RepID=A0A7C3PKL3_9CYAN
MNRWLLPPGLSLCRFDPGSWRSLPAVETLRQVGLQQYYAPGETIQLQEAKDIAPGALRIRSPYDIEAHRNCLNNGVDK